MVLAPDQSRGLSDPSLLPEASNRPVRKLNYDKSGEKAWSEAVPASALLTEPVAAFPEPTLSPLERLQTEFSKEDLETMREYFADPSIQSEFGSLTLEQLAVYPRRRELVPRILRIVSEYQAATETRRLVRDTSPTAATRTAADLDESSSTAQFDPLRTIQDPTVDATIAHAPKLKPKTRSFWQWLFGESSIRPGDESVPELDHPWSTPGSLLRGFGKWLFGRKPVEVINPPTPQEARTMGRREALKMFGAFLLNVPFLVYGQSRNTPRKKRPADPTKAAMNARHYQAYLARKKRRREREQLK